MCYVFSALYSGGLNTCSIKQTTGIQNLDLSSYLCERFSFPPIAEQKSIARFLDRETTRIDTLITKKRQLIALLQKKRFSAIIHAVTKGLDSQVDMKNANVFWLGYPQAIAVNLTQMIHDMGFKGFFGDIHRCRIPSQVV